MHVAYPLAVEDLYAKLAEVLTPLQPHQQRVIDKVRASGGLVVKHGLGSGKCARASTPVYTTRGVVPLGSLFGEQLEGPEAELTLDGGDLRVASLVDGTFRWMPVRARYRQRLPEGEHTVKVTTARGHTVELTLAHPMPVVREGCIKWVPAGELVEGDVLAACGALPPGEVCPEVPDALVELLAWQVAEGWEQETSGRLIITQDHRHLLRHLLDLFWSLHPESSSGSLTPDTCRVPALRAHCVGYRQRLEALGYIWGRRSAGKAFPASFVHLPEAQLRTLLCAFFEAEGHAAKANIEVTTASPTLSTQIEYMLLRFGVRCARRVMWKCATNGTGIKRPYIRLTLSGEDHATFVARVGFLSGRKRMASQRKGEARNPNFGTPLSWVTEAAGKVGLTPAVLGLNNCGRSPTAAPHTVRRIADRLDWLGSDEGRAHYGAQLATLHGTAYRFAYRTHLALQAHGEELRELASRVRVLLSLPLRYEPVASVQPGERGGFVYDLSVDADDYNAQNYVAGSGGLILHNTFTSIATGDALGAPIDAVTPAPLVPNYYKELDKHLGAIPEDARVRSYERAIRDGGTFRPDALAVLDEAHRIRNQGTATNALGRAAAKAKYRMLLTGTAVYNQPEDIAALLNTAAGREVVPSNPLAFRERFIGYRDPEVPLWEKLKGVALGHKMDAPAEPHLIRKNEFVQAARGYVDVHRGGGEGFPERVDEVHHVPMSDKQHELYRYYQGTMPWYLKAKVESGLPLNKQEAKELNAFQGDLRQISNTPAGYLDQGKVRVDPREHAPKVRMVADHLDAMRATDKNFRGVIYSNWLGSGVHPVSEELTRRGVPHHVFTGAISPTERKTMVEDYNAGRVPVLLLSGAGSEGLDLKGTKSIQVMEPHWNPSRIDQVIGRGIRYKSHDHLPPEERKVRVMRYYSTLPKSLLDRFGEAVGVKPKASIEQYLQQVSDEKGRLQREIDEALEEASKMGPLPTPRAPGAGIERGRASEPRATASTRVGW